MTGVIATIPRIQFSNALGIPLAGGKLRTYLAGTTTPEPTYQDQALTILNPATITLDATGSCVLWLDPAKTYKFLLTNALGVTQPGWPVDNISGASNTLSLSPTFSLYAKISTLAGAAGAALIGFLQAGADAFKRTILDKLLEITPSVDDFHFGGADHSTAFQKALNAGDVAFKFGRTYNLSGNFTNPGNRRIIIERGATVRGAFRICAYNVSNIELDHRGVVELSAVPDAPGLTLIPNLAERTQAGNERGWFECAATPDAHCRGVRVHGGGKVIGPWTGATNFDDSVYQVNRKGIAIWNMSDVLVEGMDVSGFDGEAIYWYGNSPDLENVQFIRNYVHDTRFNALNFNTTGAWKGLRMAGNMVRRAYAGVEASAGNIVDNFVRDASHYGIWQGLGGGHGPMHIKNNTIDMCDGEGIVATFAQPGIYDFSLTGNIVVGAGTNGIVANMINNFDLSSNMVRAWGRLGPGFAIKTTTTCTQGKVGLNMAVDPGVQSLGAWSIQGAGIEVLPNKLIGLGDLATTYIGNDGNFHGGKPAIATTFGNRENQFGLHSSDFNALGAGAELVWRNGYAGKTVYASIAGLGNLYDGAGSTGGLSFATTKSTTNGALTESGRFDSAGAFRLQGNLIAPFVYGNSTASSANVFIDPSGLLQRSTSAARYKTAIEDIQPQYVDAVLNLRPVNYRSACAGDKPDWNWWGLIAEEVAQVDPRLVHWSHRDTKQVLMAEAQPAVEEVRNEAGEVVTPGLPERAAIYDTVPDTSSPLVPDGVQYERLPVLMLAKMKQQEARMEKLEAALFGGVSSAT